MNASLHPPNTMQNQGLVLSNVMHSPSCIAVMYSGHVPVACGAGQGAACTETLERINQRYPTKNVSL